MPQESGDRLKTELERVLATSDLHVASLQAQLLKYTAAFCQEWNAEHPLQALTLPQVWGQTRKSFDELLVRYGAGGTILRLQSGALQAELFAMLAEHCAEAALEERPGRWGTSVESAGTTVQMATSDAENGWPIAY